MDEKIIYLVDMDGVLADTLLGFNKELKRLFPGLELLPHEKNTNFYMEMSYPQEYRKPLEEIWTKEGFYTNLEPITGAFNALRAIQKQGNDYLICTTPNLESKTCESEKKEWIEKYLGKDGVERLIMTQDKTIIIGDFLIDDKPQIKGSMSKPFWEHILYSQPWNAHVTDKKRMNWDNYMWVLPGFT